MPRFQPRYAVLFAGLFGAIAADVASKWLMLNVVMAPPRIIEVTPFFNLTLGRNTGVSFGLLQDFLAERHLLLAGMSLIIVGVVLTLAIRADRELDRLGLALIAGGAIGNIVDRLRYGAVTDFLDFHFLGWHWPTFNMADVAITAGVLILLAGLPILKSLSAQQPRAGPEESPARPER